MKPLEHYLSHSLDNFSFHKQFDLKDLSDEEKEVIVNYSKAKGLNFRVINDILRNAKNDKEVEKLAGIISSIMKKFPIKQNIITFRKISSSTAQRLFKAADVKEGDTFTDPGFVSTSSSNSFTLPGDKQKDSWTLKIYIPAGSRVISLKKFSKHKNEDEFLIDKGSQFEVMEADIEKRFVTLKLIQF